ncbi:MAG TPA: SH3 domain-containing protein [Candidatus Bipolaricaulota bacterium]|nr:SH3 domain-containing protein [Candidatus Bipolaricaulota bacterium]
MVKKLFLCLAIVCAITLIAPANVLAGEGCYQDPIYERNENGRVDTSAFVRNNACMEGTTILTTATAGSVIKIIGETDGWYKVQLADGTVGWVGARLMSKTTAALTQTQTQTQTQTKTQSGYGVPNLAKYRGYIFLQVQSRGEAYYYYPVNNKGYYLGRAEDAFKIMRELGLGATHDFIENTSYFPDHVVGRILLDVEKNGEAYYIYPKDRKKYYLGRPADAYNIMRELGLGITDSDLSYLTKAE